MALAFASRTRSLQPSQRLLFYIRLAHELTVIHRIIAQDSHTDEEKVWALFQLNEIQHTVTDHIFALHTSNEYYNEEAIERIIRSIITKAPVLEQFIEQEITWTYNMVT